MTDEPTSRKHWFPWPRSEPSTPAADERTDLDHDAEREQLPQSAEHIDPADNHPADVHAPVTDWEVDQ